MSKRIEINVVDPNFGGNEFGQPDLELYGVECPNIMKKFEGHVISNDDLTDALDTIVAFMARRRSNRIVMDIRDRDNQLAPAKEMTLEEIEKELGYKVKVISKEE